MTQQPTPAYSLLRFELLTKEWKCSKDIHVSLGNRVRVLTLLIIGIN